MMRFAAPVGFWTFGMLLLSPLPTRIVHALSPAWDGGADVYASAAARGWRGIETQFMPWTQVAGGVITAVAAWIVLRMIYENPWKRTVTATAMILMAAGMTIASPPPIDASAFAWSSTVVKVGDGVTGTTSWTQP